MLGGIEMVGVLMAAEDVNGVAAYAQPWAGNQPSVDGIANRGVRRACAFGPHIALCSESGHKIGLCGLFGENRPPGNGFLNGLQIFRAGVQEKMHVYVDKAWEQRGIAEVDHLCVLRMIDRGAHRDDSLAFDENLAGLEEVSSINLEQAGCVEHKRRRWLLRGGVQANGEQRRPQQKAPALAMRQTAHVRHA
jgi:hypothetical protein